MKPFLKVDTDALYVDQRYTRLARLANLANRHVARAVMELVWFECIRAESDRLDRDVVDELCELEFSLTNACALICEARLAEPINQHVIRVRGFTGRGDWRTSESKRRGGQARAALAQREGGRFVKGESAPIVTSRNSAKNSNDLSHVAPADQQKTTSRKPAETSTVETARVRNRENGTQGADNANKTGKTRNNQLRHQQDPEVLVPKHNNFSHVASSPPAATSKIEIENKNKNIESSATAPSAKAAVAVAADSSGPAKPGGKFATRAEITAFAPTQQQQQLARDFGLDPEGERDAFVVHALDKDREISNLEAAYRIWLRKGRDRKSATGTKPPPSGKPAHGFGVHKILAPWKPSEPPTFEKTNSRIKTEGPKS